MKKSKLLGTLMIIPTILLVLWIVFFSIFGTLFGTGSGVSVLAMLPFLVISIFQLIFLGWIFFLSLKLLKNQVLPIKENDSIAYILITIGIVYFIYNLATVLYNNITGSNPGGELQPVLAFLWGSILVSLGMALRKKSQN